MDQNISRAASGSEYHRVLVAQQRHVGRGVLAIALLIGGMLLSGVVLTTAAAFVDSFTGRPNQGPYTPLIHAAGMASVALVLPWSMVIQRWLYGVRGASLHSVRSRFRFELFGRALLLIVPAWVVVMAAQYWVPVPSSVWTYTDVLWMLLGTLLLTPLQAAGEEYGFRGLVFRVAGSWARGPRTALVIGVLVSSVTFAAVHFSSDLRLNLWYLTFAVGTALITWRTGGVEVAVVLHAGYNTLSFIFDAALRTDLANVDAQRALGATTLEVLVPGAVVVISALVVLIRTRGNGAARVPRMTAPEASPA